MTHGEILPAWAPLLTAFLVLLGAGLTLIGAIGTLRFGAFFERVHAPTLGTSWGTGAIALASIVCFSALGSRSVARDPDRRLHRHYRASHPHPPARPSIGTGPKGSRAFRHDQSCGLRKETTGRAGLEPAVTSRRRLRQRVTASARQARPARERRVGSSCGFARIAIV